MRCRTPSDVVHRRGESRVAQEREAERVALSLSAGIRRPRATYGVMSAPHPTKSPTIQPIRSCARAASRRPAWAATPDRVTAAHRVGRGQRIPRQTAAIGHGM